jgi:DNA-binding beta-propeller fold protein YncE
VAYQMQRPRLFAKLPEYVSTPDGMAIDAEGNLVLACPNFADPSMPGCLLKFDAERKVRKWADVPVHPETGHAFPMGIAFGPDGDLYVVDNQGWTNPSAAKCPGYPFKGRILRLRIRDNTVVKTTVVAHGMEHPNGMRINRNHLYVTHSMLSRVKDPSGLLVSCVYRFGLDDEDIAITNTLGDPNIFTTFLTHNRSIQYGADGIEFDKFGNLYVGNFGDGAVHKITFADDGTARNNTVWAKDPAQLKSTDGMIIDSEGAIYVADFCANAVARISPNGKVTRIAQSPDTDGLHGELDQPGEPIIWQGKLVVTCFDLVVDSQNVNTEHEMPATMSELIPG